MRKLLLAITLGMFVGLTGCSTKLGKFGADAHAKVFGCDPIGYVRPPAPERSLNAEDGIKRDIFGVECGKPYYKKPDCAVTPETPECKDGNCGLPK